MNIAKTAATALIGAITFLMLADGCAEAKRGGIARWGYNRILKRSYARPSIGSVILGTAAGAAAGTVAGEMVYDALKPEDEQKNQDMKSLNPEERHMQPRSNCKCQEN